MSFFSPDRLRNVVSKVVRVEDVETVNQAQERFMRRYKSAKEYRHEIESDYARSLTRLAKLPISHMMEHEDRLLYAQNTVAGLIQAGPSQRRQLVLFGRPFPYKSRPLENPLREQFPVTG